MEPIFRSTNKLERKSMKRRHLLISVGALFLLFALGAEFIANDTAIIYEQDGHWKCGACMEWPGKIQPPTPDNARTILQPFIRFDANALSKESLYLAPPFSSEEAGTHWLGTDSQSRDVLAGIIYGTRYALLIGFISVFFALIVGTILGGMAAYYGDHRLRIAPAASLLFLISIGAFSYASYYQLTHILVGSMAITVVFILTLTLGQSENGISWPVNQWVTKGIELFDSLPALFVLLAFAATIQNWNIWTLSLLIAFFRWPTFARLTRSEMTPWANSAWIKALRDLEMPDLWIVRTQLLNLVIVPISMLPLP
jgi:ABC-type dipeptide/oligopeptide/nickel transport system permease subunit